MLEVRNLHVFYGGIHALKSVTLELSQGEIVTLIGSNGAGKSTTLMSISGIVPPRSGEIIFQGTPIQGMSPDVIFSLGIVQVPEGRRIFPQLSVVENLHMGAYLRKDRHGIRDDIDYVFGIFPRLAERRHQLGGTLSGGEQQMLAIARALAGECRIMLLDEPTEGIQPSIVDEILELLARVNAEEALTIFLVEQNMELALSVAHDYYVMEKGVIVDGGPVAGMNKDEVIEKYLVV